mgnify:FL=1
MLIKFSDSSSFEGCFYVKVLHIHYDSPYRDIPATIFPEILEDAHSSKGFSLNKSITMFQDPPTPTRTER